jgi:hypothetical protein
MQWLLGCNWPSCQRKIPYRQRRWKLSAAGAWRMPSWGHRGGGFGLARIWRQEGERQVPLNIAHAAAFTAGKIICRSGRSRFQKLAPMVGARHSAQEGTVEAALRRNNESDCLGCSKFGRSYKQARTGHRMVFQADRVMA